VTTATKQRPAQVEQRHTPEQAAALMAVSKDFILTAIRAGALPAKKVGKGYRIKGSDLDSWYETLEDA
jgi:excisionase family DNA binding protein